jgi:hypothetical protein
VNQHLPGNHNRLIRLNKFSDRLLAQRTDGGASTPTMFGLRDSVATLSAGVRCATAAMMCTVQASFHLCCRGAACGTPWRPACAAAKGEVKMNGRGSNLLI